MSSRMRSSSSSSETEMAFQLSQKLAKADLLVFFDIEGTQFTHKMIAFGMVCYPKKKDVVSFDRDGSFSYHSYVKTKDDIGPVVKEMIGISKDILALEGKDIRKVVLEVDKLLRPYHPIFISYGTSDILMMKRTLDRTDVTEENFFRYVMKNYLDFHQYVSRRICDENGHSLSISKLMDLYRLPKAGPDHDPLCDAKNLSMIYDAYVNRVEDDVSFFYQNLIHNREAKDVFRQVTELLIRNKIVKEEELLSLLRKHL